MRGIREVERKIVQIENCASENETIAASESATEQPTAEMAEAQIAKKYIAAVRALLLEDGDPPLELPEWCSRLNEHVERRRFNRDPKAYLAALEHEWDQ